MHTIAVLSEKGGVGKTTIALDLAVTADHLGKRATVLDIDPQATASKWTDRRVSDTPRVIPTHGVRLGAAISKAKADGVELVVIDTPPHSSADAVEAARWADFVLVPVEPHVFSLDTLAKSADLLNLAGAPAACYVINKAPTQGSEVLEALAYISGLGLLACPVILHLRAAHRHASNAGKSAAEFEASSKAASETFELYNYVLQALRKGKNGKVNAR